MTISWLPSYYHVYMCPSLNVRITSSTRTVGTTTESNLIEYSRNRISCSKAGSMHSSKHSYQSL